MFLHYLSLNFGKSSDRYVSVHETQVGYGPFAHDLVKLAHMFHNLPTCVQKARSKLEIDRCIEMISGEHCVLH